MFGRTGPPNFSGPHTRVPRKLPINKSKENVSEHTIPVIEIMHHCMQNRHRNCMTKVNRTQSFGISFVFHLYPVSRPRQLFFFRTRLHFCSSGPDFHCSPDKPQRLGKLNSCVQTVHIYVIATSPKWCLLQPTRRRFDSGKKNGPIDFALMLKWRTGFAGV